MPATSIDALLLVDKPAGVSSHDVVAVVRRALGGTKVGHAGTLDPFATGLLVVLAGRGTRLMPYLPGEPKIYDARIQFGAETDTDDRTGVVTRQAPPPGRARVDAAVAALTGLVEQVPPAYSAKQVEGTRAYAAARRGRPLALDPVAVDVASWTVLSYEDGCLHAEITCAGGTYIRALARDLGRLSGSAAHLAELRRLRSGPFQLADAAQLEDVRQGRAPLLPLLSAVPGLPRQPLDDGLLRLVRHGRGIPAQAGGPRAALIAPDGTLAAIADRDGDQWSPRLVLVDG